MKLRVRTMHVCPLEGKALYAPGKFRQKYFHQLFLNERCFGAMSSDLSEGTGEGVGDGVLLGDSTGIAARKGIDSGLGDGNGTGVGIGMGVADGSGRSEDFGAPFSSVSFLC